MAPCHRKPTSNTLRYGTHCQGISQFCLHTPRIYDDRISHTCLCLPSHNWSSFTNPEGMEGRVVLGNQKWLHSWPRTVTHQLSWLVTVQSDMTHWAIRSKQPAQICCLEWQCLESNQWPFELRVWHTNHYTPSRQVAFSVMFPLHVNSQQKHIPVQVDYL